MAKNVIEEVLEEIKGSLVQKVEKKLFSDKTKDILVKKMNDAIDIPFVSEKMEGKAIDSMVSVIFGVFRGVLKLESKEDD